MDMVLVKRFEVAAVRRPQDEVGHVFSNNLGDHLCNPFLDVDFCKAEDVLSVGFVLGVAVDCDFWFDGAGVGAYEIPIEFFLAMLTN